MSERLLIRIAGDTRAPSELPRAGKLVIGSSEDKAGLVVEGQGVSDVHCAIGILKGGGWAVKDLGSEFGTLVNGEKVSSARVKRGDVILLGSKRLTIVSSEELEQETEEPAARAPKEKLPTGELPKPQPPRELTETQRAPLLGGYRVEKTLGRGAMGKVFLAVQESLDRRVALKVMAPHLAKDSAFVQKFQREARSAASLTHPNVVIVHDVGEQKGFHYLSMEYMDRGSLEDLLAERGKLSPREVLDILRDAASGLVYAEARGIVHRDIKPANLMRNHQGATKIADLGLATSVEAESELEDQGGKKVFGTPHFISPEQLRGETVDARSDLYSLGATTFQLLTGRTPFEGETTRDILRGHLKEDPPNVTEIASEVPRELAALVDRLLQKEPSDRFPSAGALLAEVERIRTGVAGTSAVPGAGGGKGKLIAAVVGLLVIAGITGFILSQGGDPETPNPNGTGGPEVVDAGNGAGAGHTPTNDNNGGMGSGGTAAVDDNTDSNDGSGDNEPDDRDLRIFELEAEGEFLRLSQQDLPTAERVSRLRDLATKYDGTDAARQAREQATQLESASAEEAARLTARDAQVKTHMAGLRKAARLEDAVPNPSEAMTALIEYALPPELASDAGLATERKNLQGQVIAKANEFATQKLAEAKSAAEAGEKDKFLASLAAIVNNLGVPSFEGEAEIAGLDTLRETRKTARSDMERADIVLADYASKQAAEDAMKMASALGGAKGLESELGRVDLAAAIARIDGALQDMPTQSLRDVLTELRGDCVAAQAALGFVSSNFSDWRRKTVDDPRTGKSATATGANAQGIMIAGEHVPWAEFGGKTSSLSRLFEGRFGGGYDPEVQRGIIALLRISLAIEVVQGASEMFYPGSNAQFTKGEARELTEGYEQLFEWLESASDPSLLAIAQRDHEAALLLGKVLRSTDEQDWIFAVAGMERLLAEYDGTLIVLLMSDGTS